ncbi:MAG: hypothetical protein VB072_17245 [Lentimicrobium sp.]|jgi:hypothetical protein|nr:hypothetical protein [Lentimicrobium sp.]MEA5112171.1 hypothetical protein [Lentimicrobium sp.]
MPDLRCYSESDTFGIIAEAIQDIITNNIALSGEVAGIFSHQD